MDAVIQGKFLQYEAKNAQKQDGTKYIQHVFTFEVPGGVADITMQNEDYINNILENNGVKTIEEYAESLKGKETPLYFSSSKDFSGYSLTEPFVKNNFPNKMGIDVLIEKIDDTPSGVNITLADGTTARRSFSKQIGGKDGEYYPDIQKRLRFISHLTDREGKKITTDPLNYDLKQIEGMLMSYQIKEFGDKKYLDVLSVMPNTQQVNDDLLAQLTK